MQAVNWGCEGSNEGSYPEKTGRSHCLPVHTHSWLTARNPVTQFVFSGSRRTHCGEFVCRDFFLALCNGVEEQVLQTGQNACLPSPTGQKTNNNRHLNEKNNITLSAVVGAWRGSCSRRREESRNFTTARRHSNCDCSGNHKLTLSSVQHCNLWKLVLYLYFSIGWYIDKRPL